MHVKGQVQALLFERAYKSAKALFMNRKKKPSFDYFVLGNVGVSHSLRFGSVECESLSWDVEDSSLESIVFNLGAVIRFESINLELVEELEIDRLSLLVDGNFVVVNISQEFSRNWRLRPVELSVPFIGRYLMLKGPSSLLISIKRFSIKNFPLL